MKRLLLFVLAGLVFVASGCSQAAPTEVVVQVTSVEAAVPEATPTPESAPAALLEQMPLLEEHGYSLQQGERGWDLVDKTGHVVLTASDTLTVTAQAREGEILILPAESFKVRETIGAGIPIVLTFKDTTQEGETAHIYLDQTDEWVTPVELQTDPRETDNYTHVTLDDFLTGRVLYSELLKTEPFPAEAIRPDRYEYVIYPTGGITDYAVLLHAVINGNRDDSVAFWDSQDININNDYIRQAFFYTLDTQEGVRAIIHTQQQLDPQGDVLSFHLSHGPNMPLAGEWARTGHGYQFNLLNSVFLARSEQPPEGFRAYTTPPVIHEERGPNYNTTDWAQFGRNNMGAREVRNLSLVPENDLLNIGRLGDIIRRAWEQNKLVVPASDNELRGMQLKVISTTARQAIAREYYRP
ncbi:MAG: hypothetical protein KIS80_04365 [Anaerolineales bacterium]|nr:hypothetical protein [Anaerolineales bacterium]